MVDCVRIVNRLESYQLSPDSKLTAWRFRKISSLFRRVLRMEANNNNINIPPDELTQVYFSDQRIQQTLRTIRNINSSVALPSLFLLIPVTFFYDQYTYF